MPNTTSQAAPTGAAAPALSAWNLINIELETRFTLTPTGRIEREADPDRSPGPLMFLAGCDGGALVQFSHELEDDLVAELKALSVDEPPLSGPGQVPVHIEQYLDLLGAFGPLQNHLGLSFHLPHRSHAQVSAPLIASGTAEGDHLQATLTREGMPPALVEMGFRDAGDLWAPWCLALQDGQIASLAFAARLGGGGAELGLATLPAFRGLGLAAAATAGWSALPSLADRTLFYSTATSNLASQRVVTKLGLKFIGPTWAISRA
ncbi:GNAT family N-acetyltransferase [Phenylobacterium sp.]|uniref:GNAT family N-acetyltransferase n=1 Tax=Phenylobacterium sp. TaxID=1871053 RepID=UPI0027310E50|nr:GNAT family N-acetyltransferase [Phenylobacterium sp.]MDP1601593.1 GNAT family N-acetyltransferase [Phenylobacterium sp.]MDP3593178.1 GNAT family N-acetyltransferase [Phenylobacterium sp.]